MKNLEHGSITKKAGLLCVALLSMFVSACPLDTYEPTKTGTSLIINNLSDYPIISVEYSSVDFGTIKNG
ncbi:MAG: hypothetical protein LBB43_06070 [Spirochaetaceae bacterium]|jgi:hypothetical protein|nr:hypothetical protein [Spirochaetaceae bacterium]